MLRTVFLIPVPCRSATVVLLQTFWYSDHKLYYSTWYCKRVHFPLTNVLVQYTVRLSVWPSLLHFKAFVFAEFPGTPTKCLDSKNPDDH